MVFTALRGRERPMRRRVNPAKSKVEAKPPVVRKSRTSEGSRVNDLEKRLAEALERETAAAEILRVISSSPTDAQPVFDAIAESAVRLCEVLYANVSTFDGRMLRYVAFNNVRPAAIAMLREKFPSPPTRGGSSGRAILDRAVVHIPDGSADPEYEFSDIASTANYRALVAVPMLREGSPIGAINVARAQVGPFSDEHIELLQTFADPAVIAIENVRLFTELQEKNRQVTEALEQQTATAEILSVISSSGHPCRADGARRPADRLSWRDPQPPRRVPYRDDRAASDLRDAVGAGHSECPALPRDPGQKQPTRSRQPAQV